MTPTDLWWNDGHELNVSERVRGEKQTSTVAEIQAIIRVIEIATKIDIKKLQINTDSKTTINAVNKFPE